MATFGVIICGMGRSAKESHLGFWNFCHYCCFGKARSGGLHLDLDFELEIP